MLSNKLTFSLVLVLMLAFAATSVYAQNVPAAAVPGASGFGVVTAPSPANGIDDDVADAELTGMPNLADLLQFGGTIEVLMPVVAAADPATNTFHASGTAAGTSPLPISEDDAKAAMHRVVITEIMWALDGADGAVTAQWIELHNPGAAILPATDGLRLNFIYNQRAYRVGQTIRDLDNDGAVDATDETLTYVVVDAVSTVDRFGRFWELKGQSGNSVRGTDEEEPVSNLVSMYRKRSLEDKPSPMAYKFKSGAPDGDKFTDGTDGGQWIASAARRNMTGAFIGTPGSVHVERPGAGKIFDLAAVTAATAGSGIIINEVRDDPSRANVDWIELYNNSAVTTAPISVKNWRVRLATATMNDDGTYKDHKTSVLAILPDYRIPAGEYLLIVNRDPEDTDLAGGENLADIAEGGTRKVVKRGATHVYHISDGSADGVDGLDLPGSGKYLIVLRSGDKGDDNYHEQFVDFAGNGFFKEDSKAGTDVWPLRGWKVPGDVDQADFGGDNTFSALGMSFARTHSGSKVNSGANRLHKDHWAAVSAQGGIGYDRDVDLATSPGTPGYANNAHLGFVDNDQGNADATDDVMYDGMVTISEVMYDAGSRGRTPQWIELHNSSMTQAINLKGWEMAIRNKEYDGKFYVDANFEFEDATILPNQTLLLVSKSGPNDVADNRVYNLLAKHQRDLNLLPGNSILLSPGGFYLKLTAKSMVGGRTVSVDMDEAGNLMADGARLTAMWELPPVAEGGARQSLVRAYGPMALDAAGTPEAAADGTMESSWIASEAGTFYYGDRGDMGTPGYRKGGPLPVSLSSFRPVRNQTTGHVDITWITQSELNNAGFNILRSETKTGEFKVINVKGIVAGHGTTSEKHVYTFTDTTAKPNIVYYYQIEDVSINGQRTTLTTTHLRGNVSAGGKLATRWGELKSSVK